ncbi:MAG TPA: thymidylate synthase [Rhodoglobus sp.]|nr:thymidylate synthase [Rhodoglobus sp.]
MNANQTLQILLSRLLTEGKDVPSRVGNTKELTFQSFMVRDPQNRYITAPGRHVSVPAQIAETMWVLAGRNDTEWLSAYLPQAPKFADDGEHWRAGYGPRIRSWNGEDQLENVIRLLREDPMTRQAVISIWDPASDLTSETLDRPCNNWLHFLTRDGVLNLNIAIRSNDVMWGWSGINFFEWSVLLEVVASCTGLKVGNLYFNVSSLHLYERHFEKAKRIVESKAAALLMTSSGSLGLRWSLGLTNLKELDDQIDLWFRVEGEIRKGHLEMISQVTDPLLHSWLWAIAYYWGHTEEATDVLRGTDILPALKLSPKRKIGSTDQLVEIMTKLHTEKSRAYGDSWKKRGEIFSILPNIARKVDRIIANAETSDETKLDTAMDLVIYLAKYKTWLESGEGATLELENTSVRDVVRGTREQGNLDHAFENVLEAAQGHQFRPIKPVTAIAVNHLLELWEGPEGRALRNNTKSWNPE